jgi:hypothetical protein
MHAQLGEPRLPGILEQATVGGRRGAIFVIAVDRLDLATCVGDPGD